MKKLKENAMRTHIKFKALMWIVLLGASLPGKAIDTRYTKLLSQPAISQTHIAFVYAGDLWVADSDGSNVRRLTSDEGVESNPIFSPDGQWIAFNGQYDGNTDVFIIPAAGGIPRRLTWHPYPDFVCDFTPDGSRILFRSQRDVFTRRFTRLFTISTEGDFPESLKIPNAFKAAYAPDGRHIAYTPLPEPFNQWKHYRGGTTSRIWIFSFEDHNVVQIPQPEGRCNDTDPMWMEDHVYFRSDRNGEFNLFAYDIASQTVSQLTDHTEFGVQSASCGTGKIIYEQAGVIHTYDVNTSQSEQLVIGVAADLQELRSRYVRSARFARNGSVSPSGARAVVEFRGEIITVPKKKGDARNLTQSTGVHERHPEWSPDGKHIAYFSDASGEYALHINTQDGRGKTKIYTLNGTGFYSRLTWSPDSKKLTFTDNGRNLYWLEIQTGDIRKIDEEPLYMPGDFGLIRGDWSPDSRWIVYTVPTRSYMQRVYVYDTVTQKTQPITDGLSEVSEPVFDRSGMYLYFFASTDAGPVKHWFAQSNADMEMRNSIYVATLNKETPNPLAKESDEEKSGEAAETESESKKKDTGKHAGDEGPKPVIIDFEKITDRIVALPIPAGRYRDLQAGKANQIFYLETVLETQRPGHRLHRYDLEEREDKVVCEGINGYVISADTKMMLTVADTTWSLVEVSDNIEPEKGTLGISTIQVKIDPRSEWRQIFNEAWRINRDYFYDPNFHGTDWHAMREKYAAFLPHLSCRADLNRIIRWMCSELTVGHSYLGGGDFLYHPARVGGGLLGADYTIENGRYRFTKVFGGLNWNPNLRSPLREPGIDVREGEYLLAVNGKDLRPPENLFSRFENTAGKIVEITVGPDPDGKNARTLKVVPVSNENNMRNRDWVERNIRKVDAATNGRVAYVYVPNTAGLGHTYFKRYFFPQSHKEAVIVDERFNGGGSVADYYIDHLRRPFVSQWAMRYGRDLVTPSGAIFGPKVMIIDETAGSGGDLLPWMFRRFKLGKLVGKRTWGGLVGILGYPVLMDGGYITSPNLAFFTEKGWEVENEGVPPDIEVEQWPAEVIKGRDPQLEKAIEIVMEELEANPVVLPEKKPFPVRVK